MTEETITVLIVDDNTRYREAFGRNLVAEGMQVVQAEDGEQALALLRNQNPDVMVTDLQMRTETEGLDLIRNALAQNPCLPIIMISAVGSFDEGALAQKLGAMHVLSKARIEEEMTLLYDSIREAFAAHAAAREALIEIDELRTRIDEALEQESTEVDFDAASQRLVALHENTAMHPYVRTEAFDLMCVVNEAQRNMQPDAGAQALAGAEQQDLEKVEAILKEEIPEFDSLASDTKGSLRIAEYLFQHSETLGSHLDLARTTCFSYCFSVENQAKFTLRRRLAKFLAEKSMMSLIQSLMERPGNQVNMFLQQYIIQTMREYRMDFSIDNVRQTFLRILEHQIKYRPDGLKALGILVLLFGRTYSFANGPKGAFAIDNPLNLKGLEDDEDVLKFVELLISVQHLRNPYIHPEISGREGIGKIRGTAIECLNMLLRLR